MFEIWAKLGLFVGLLVLAGVLWFILTIICKALFEDLAGTAASKLSRQVKIKLNKDHYQY